ncbi:hypothetical protein RLOC_00000184 [Lonchura striata]|uniref:Uncharacterized protein n=1 Tax=Lonchura striata TaxID=40157 RepID=A0A218V117_9PASE|nr:hypothetical protein RLOC_00000184 [Lonchura striata domestica]
MTPRARRDEWQLLSRGAGRPARLGTARHGPRGRGAEHSVLREQSPVHPAHAAARRPARVRRSALHPAHLQREISGK